MIALDITKKLDSPTGTLVLDIQLNVEKGRILTIYGVSGAGKTSLLRMIAGLMTPDSGSIQINNDTWFDSASRTNLAPRHRKVGFIFQDYALFPNMTVLQNLQYPLEKGQDSSIVRDLLDVMEIQELQDRKPATLSGGQKQRVALARALVNRPEILLLDEPLSALDASMRTKLQDYLVRIQKAFGLTLLLVSHDVGEIIRLSHSVSMLENGVLTPPESPHAFFHTDNERGKFVLQGEVMRIDMQDQQVAVTLLTGGALLKILVMENDMVGIKTGDKIAITAEGLKPVAYDIVRSPGLRS